MRSPNNRVTKEILDLEYKYRIHEVLSELNSTPGNLTGSPVVE